MLFLLRIQPDADALYIREKLFTMYYILYTGIHSICNCFTLCLLLNVTCVCAAALHNALRQEGVCTTYNYPADVIVERQAVNVRLENVFMRLLMTTGIHGSFRIVHILCKVGGPAV
jgi:hypothetical protein